MNEEELRKNDILFKIDMQLYDEFNDKLCEMNGHIGDIYSLRDIEEVKQAEKEKERELLREAIKKLQKENEELKEENFDQVYMKAIADYKEKIRNKIKELENKKEQYIEQPLIYHILKNQLEELLGDE